MMNRRMFVSLALIQAAPTALRVESASPSLAEGDRLLIETTQLLGAVSGASDRFSLVQQYMAHRQLVTEYFEKVYPGQTIDWSVIPAMLKAKP